MRNSSPGAELFVDARRPPQTSLTAQAIRGDRGVPGGWLPVRPRPPAPPGCGGCLPRFWMEQAHADQPPVVIDALDRVSVQLELADDCGREGNPASVQLGKSDRLVAGLAQALQQPLLLSVSERHRPDCRPPAGLGEPRAALAGGGARGRCADERDRRRRCRSGDRRSERHTVGRVQASVDPDSTVASPRRASARRTQPRHAPLRRPLRRAPRREAGCRFGVGLGSGIVGMWTSSDMSGFVGRGAATHFRDTDQGPRRSSSADFAR